jgi:hypothetical protein
MPDHDPSLDRGLALGDRLLDPAAHGLGGRGDRRLADRGTAPTPLTLRSPVAQRDRLRKSTDAERGIVRRRGGEGFRYIGPGGRPVRDAATLARVSALAIPPAWQEVWICRDAIGHLQAVGRDARGHKRYRYHAAWHGACGTPQRLVSSLEPCSPPHPAFEKVGTNR